MRLAMIKKTVQRFSQWIGCFMPFVPEQHLRLALAGESPRLEANENDGRSVSTGNNGRFVFLVANDHVGIVPASSAALMRNVKRRN